jgi:hypothetical protein
MGLEIDPTVPEAAQTAVVRALATAGVRMQREPDVYASPWRRAGAREAVECQPPVARYAPSPRSTRGATRA